MGSSLRWVLLLLSGGAALGQEDGGWETVVAGPPMTVRNRGVEGTAIREVWATVEVAAPVQDIQAALGASETYWRWMPYVRESRYLGEVDPDGYRHVYTMVDLPLVGRRDFVVKTHVLEGVKPDGSGTFRNAWMSEPTAIPVRSDVTRMLLTSGSWEVTPLADGAASHVEYRFIVDPAGWVPAFAANLGNRKGLDENFKAVEKEAQRRRDERLVSSKKQPRVELGGSSLVRP